MGSFCGERMISVEHPISLSQRLRSAVSRAAYDLRVPQDRHQEALDTGIDDYERALRILSSGIPYVAHRDIYLRMVNIRTSDRYRERFGLRQSKFIYHNRPILALTTDAIIVEHQDIPPSVYRQDTYIVLQPNKPDVRWIFFHELTRMHRAGIEIYAFRNPPACAADIARCIDDLEPGSRIRFDPCETAFTVVEPSAGLEHAYMYWRLGDPETADGTMWVRFAFERLQPHGNIPETVHKTEQLRIMQFGLTEHFAGSFTESTASSLPD